MNISVKNIRQHSDTADFIGFLFDLVVNDITIVDLFEHDNVINCDCIDSYYDTNARAQIDAALASNDVSEDDRDYVLENAFSVIHEALSVG
jgi:hypothetical protein